LERLQATPASMRGERRNHLWFAGMTNLLANATTEGTRVEAKRAFVSILQDFGHLEAKLLGMIYLAPAGPVSGRKQSYQSAGLVVSFVPKAVIHSPSVPGRTFHVLASFRGILILSC
jgi:hypothetical protein